MIIMYDFWVLLNINIRETLFCELYSYTHADTHKHVIGVDSLPYYNMILSIIMVKILSRMAYKTCLYTIYLQRIY